MSALQNLTGYELVAHPAFTVNKGEARKTTSLCQWVEQESCTAQGNEDQELIERAMAGDSAAQRWLFTSHTPRLYAVAFNVLHNKEDAEDAVQDGWCRAYSKLHTFERRSSLSTWLTRIVINSALMIRRRNKHQLLTSLDDAAGDARGLEQWLVDERRSPEEMCGDGEVNELLVREIERLPSPSRTAFLLRDVDELSTSESMERLGLNKSALKSRVVRARRRIAQNMRRLLRADCDRNRCFEEARLVPFRARAAGR